MSFNKTFICLKFEVPQIEQAHKTMTKSHFIIII